MLQKSSIKLLAFVLIIVLTAFLRIYKLNSVPPELFGDELDVGYQAYSILKTGRDLYGNFLPTYIQSLSESRAPLFIYSAVPFIGFFGLNEWGVRLTAVFWGILGVIAIYFLTQKLFSNYKLSTISSLLLAISPWHLQYSRAGFEVTLLFFLVVTATWSFLQGLKHHSFLMLSALLFALTPYTYSTATVFLPVFLLSLVVIFWKDLFTIRQNIRLKIAVVILVVVLIPFGRQIVFGQASERFSKVSIAGNPEIVKSINESRSLDQKFGFVFHNKPLSYLYKFGKNYLSAFSPQFLFSEGDPIGRHSVGQMGQLYWFMLPLLLLGTFKLFNSNDNREAKNLLIAWLLLAPIPSSLTYDGASHATRLFLLLPPLIILSSIGAYQISTDIIQSKSKIIAALVIFAIAIINLTTFFHRYWVDYPKESWRWWQIGYKEAFSFIAKYQNEYDRILINNTYEPALIRFLFYAKYDPDKFHKTFVTDKSQEEVFPRFDGFPLEEYSKHPEISPKVYFGTISSEKKGAIELSQVIDQNTLYLASHQDEIIGLDLRKGAPSDLKVLKTITNYLDQPLFYLLTRNSHEFKIYQK